VSEGLQITLASGDAASQLLRLGAALEQEARAALGDHAFSLAHELGRPSGGVLVAWLAAVPIGLLSFLRVADELHLLSVVVTEAHLRSGVGLRLVTAAQELGRADGAAVFLLEVRRSNLAARRLYERLGFFCFNVRKAYYPDGEDALELVVELEPGQADRFLPAVTP
jgi:[ribosomal protein S18]-alanine N-acetyltransferase